MDRSGLPRLRSVGTLPPHCYQLGDQGSNKIQVNQYHGFIIALVEMTYGVQTEGDHSLDRRYSVTEHRYNQSESLNDRGLSAYAQSKVFPPSSLDRERNRVWPEKKIEGGQTAQVFMAPAAGMAAAMSLNRIAANPGRTV